jgi:hypothetical protein
MPGVCDSPARPERDRLRRRWAGDARDLADWFQLLTPLLPAVLKGSREGPVSPDPSQDRQRGHGRAGLDPVIHAPARLRMMVTLATLPDGDTLSFTRLQDMIGLTPAT